MSDSEDSATTTTPTNKDSKPDTTSETKAETERETEANAESDPKTKAADAETDTGTESPSKPALESDSQPKMVAASQKSKSKSTKELSQSAKRRAAMPTPLDGFRVVETSWGYPGFAREFPRHPELDDLVAAFARGDYHTVRERAPKLAASSTDERIKRAAEMLRARIEPDPTSKILFAFAALLLAFLTFYWVKHSGPEGGLPQTSPKPAKSVPTVEHVD